MIYLAGGTVHTLGPGSVIVETQPAIRHHLPSLRLRRPRPLHLEHGLASIKERNASGKVIRPAPVGIHAARAVSLP